jgi:hypothetical protein
MVRGRKFDPKWVGPFRIERKISDWVYQFKVGGKQINLNVEQLNLCRTPREQFRENRRRRRQEHRKRNQSTWEHSNPAVDSENDTEEYVERVPFELSTVTDDRPTQEHIDEVADTSLSDKTADTLSEENNCTSMPSIDNDAETGTTSADGNANTEVGRNAD